MKPAFIPRNIFLQLLNQPAGDSSGLAGVRSSHLYNFSNVSPKYLLCAEWWLFHSTQLSSIMMTKGQTSFLLTPSSSSLFLSSSRLWYDSSLIMKRAAPVNSTCLYITSSFLRGVTTPAVLFECPPSEQRRCFVSGLKVSKCWWPLDVSSQKTLHQRKVRKVHYFQLSDTDLSFNMKNWTIVPTVFKHDV